jgi:hypothetical protein
MLPISQSMKHKQNSIRVWILRLLHPKENANTLIFFKRDFKFYLVNQSVYSSFNSKSEHLILYFHFHALRYD